MLRLRRPARPGTLRRSCWLRGDVMKTLLGLIGGAAWALGVAMLFFVESAMQETSALLIMLNGTVALSAAAVIDAIERRRARTAEDSAPAADPYAGG